MGTFQKSRGIQSYGVVVVGLVFQQQESVKSELIEKLFIGSYSSRSYVGSSSANGQRCRKTKLNKSSHFPFLSPREENPSPSTKGRIQSSPPFPARLRLFVSFLLPAACLCPCLSALLHHPAPALFCVITFHWSVLQT